jgi:hypothetical protein
VFLIRNKIHRGVPLVSLSLSTPGLLVSALPPPSAPRAAPGQADTATRRAAPLSEAAPSPLSELRRRLVVGAPLDRACMNAAVSAIQARLAAWSRPTPPPVRPSGRRLPRVPTPPCLTPKPAAAPHHFVPFCAGARREEPPHHRNFGRLRRHDPLHGERNPKHSLAAFFSGYICA